MAEHSREQLIGALRRADAAGDVPAAQAIARRIKSMEAAPATKADFSSVTSKVSSTATESNPRPRTRTAELVERGAIPQSWQIPVEAAEQGLRSARQGLTLGFSDELAGAGAGINALIRGEDVGAAYRASRDRERALSGQFAEDYPSANLAGQLGGGLLTGSAPAKAVAQAPNLLSQIGRGTLAGGITGGAAGLGASEATTISGAAGDAGGGAALGAGIGAVAPPLLLAGQAAISAAARKLRPSRPASAANTATPTGAQPPPATEHNRLAGPPLTTEPAPRERALSVVGSTLRRSNTTPEAIERLLASNEALGVKPEVLADYLGDHGARRLYSARTLGGAGSAEAMERLANRGEGSAARVSDDVQRATTQRGNSLQQLETRIENRRRAGNALYRDANKHGAIKDPETIHLVQNPEVADILSKASDRRVTVANLLGETYSPLFKKGPDGPVLARSPTVEDLHLLKTSLDDDIRQAYQSGEGQLGTALRSFKNNLVARLEAEVPAYRKARDTYRGDMEMEEAIENGRNDILRKPVDELRRDISALSDSERDAYRSGAIDTVLAQKVDRKPDASDFARVLWGNADMRNRLRLLVKNDDELVKLVAQLEREKRMTRTNQATLGGSQTAMRNADIEDTAAETIADVATHGATGAVMKKVQQAIRRAGGITEPVADDIARLLMTEGPKEIRAVLSVLKDREKRQVIDAVARRRAAQSAANVTGQEVAGGAQ